MISSTLGFRVRPSIGLPQWTPVENVKEGLPYIANAEHNTKQYAYVFSSSMVNPANPFEIPPEIVMYTPRIF